MMTTETDVRELIRDAMFNAGMTDIGGAFEDAGIPPDWVTTNGAGFIVKLDAELEDDSEFQVTVKQIR